jgi:two-component system cell cycle sensor histidine kinase/response regulator CckA
MQSDHRDGGSSGGHDRRGLDRTDEALRESDTRAHLRRSEAGFRTLIESLPDTVVVHRAGRIVYVNPAALRLLGYERIESLEGRSVLDLVHPDDRAGVSQRIGEILVTGRQAVFREERLVRRDGSTVTAEVTGMPVEFDGGPAIAALAHDVTEKRQMLAQLAQADRLASMGLLAASVAHEVNNPLAYVLLNLERLAKALPAIGSALSNLQVELTEVIGEEQAAGMFQRTGSASAARSVEELAARVQTVTEGARQVARIARDLTAFARVEQDERRQVDVHALLDKGIDIAANQLRFRATVVREYGDIPSVLANEGRLSQVFLNLLVNAAHAIDEGAPEQNVVRVSTSADQREVRIAVGDTGRGIEKEHLPRLFELFFTTRASGQGSGLGLSICRDIVQGHGGRIEVESEPGRGSRFTVVLPAGEPRASLVEAPAAAPPETPVPAKLRRVLVVDDERTLRATLAALLSDHYEVVLAESGATAIRLLAQDRDFDAIVCDLMMPEVSGMDVHAWMTREAPELLQSLIFMTGGAFTRDARELLERAANPYIEKPFEVRELIAALEQVIARGQPDSAPHAAAD